MRVKGLEWNQVNVGVSLVEWYGANECKSNGKGCSGRIEWNEVDLGVILVYNWDIMECINMGVWMVGEQQNTRQQPIIKKVKMEQKPPLDAKWKITIETKVNSLMAIMAKLESLLKSMTEIKAILQSGQHQ